MAGLGNVDTIQLMSEPDAAAAWTLLRDINPNNLKVRSISPMPLTLCSFVLTQPG